MSKVKINSANANVNNQRQKPLLEKSEAIICAY